MDGWTAETSDLRLRIEHWPEGFYLFVIRKPDTIPFRDELQDTLEIAISAARDDYAVEPATWKRESWPASLR